MARRELTVQHFVACETAITLPRESEHPYTLHRVQYRFAIPAAREWPARLEDLWLFARFRNGRGTEYFELDVVWLDGPDGEREVAWFPDFQVQFGSDDVESRVFRIHRCRFPGPGRYLFRLRSAGRSQPLAREYIRIQRRP